MWKQLIEKKFHTNRESFSHTLSQWKFFGEKIVFTNGCFDLLHLGHLTYLMQAKELGNKLVIGLNTDASVQRLKGPQRPIRTEQERGLMLASLAFVDAVILFDEDTPESLIRWVQPHILVKGKDYENKEIAGADFVKAIGGIVQLVDLVENYSTTALINRIHSQK